MVFCIIRCLWNCGTCFYVSEWHAHTSSKCATVTLRRENTSHNFKHLFNHTIIAGFDLCQMLWFSVLYVVWLKLWDVFSRLSVTAAHLFSSKIKCALKLWDVKTRPTISYAHFLRADLLRFSNRVRIVLCHAGAWKHVPSLQRFKQIVGVSNLVRSKTRQKNTDFEFYKTTPFLYYCHPGTW